MKLLVPILAAGLMAGVFVPLYFQVEKQKALHVLMKGFATLCPAVLCLIAAVQGGSAPASWTAAGLWMCLNADVLLDLWFYWGMGAFALGHGLYIIAFLQAAPFHWSSFLFFPALAGVLAFLFYTWRDKVGRRLAPFAAYGLILCAMTCLALPLSYTMAPLRGWLLAAGASFFALSDGLLCRNILMGASRGQRMFSLYVYYLGQFLLALAWYL